MVKRKSKVVIEAAPAVEEELFEEEISRLELIVTFLALCRPLVLV